MKAYIVRAIYNKVILGFLVVRTLNELWHMVDEVDNPNEYEYAKAGRGGLFWLLSDTPDTSDENGISMFGASLSEAWEGVAKSENLRWTPLQTHSPYEHQRQALAESAGDKA